MGEERGGGLDPCLTGSEEEEGEEVEIWLGDGCEAGGVAVGLGVSRLLSFSS